MTAKQFTGQKVPMPKVTRAILMSAGCPHPTPTVHHYVATNPTTLPDGQPVFEHIFQCFKTGARRRWGYEDRVVLTEIELKVDIEREGN